MTIEPDGICVNTRLVCAWPNCSSIHNPALYELHGNRYVEKCVRCKKDYLRDFYVRKSKKVHQHLTGK